MAGHEPLLDSVEAFLRKVDGDFPMPLSQRVDLGEYAAKIVSKATLCIQWDGSDIVSMVAGYTDDVIDDMAYITMVATRSDARGKGSASRLLSQFLDIAHKKGLKAVHLLTDMQNTAAMHLYFKAGFSDWPCQDDTTTERKHLIRYLTDKD